MIRHAVRLYYRFTLSFRDVEELLAQRGIEVSYETVRCWTLKFGPQIAANLRRRRGSPTGRWHLDEMFVRVGESKMWLWRAVDDEGEVLERFPFRMNRNGALESLLGRSSCSADLIQVSRETLSTFWCRSVATNVRLR